MIAIELKSLSKRFNGIHAIDGVSFHIEAGRITGIIGPNGSGKSTLVNVLSGMMQATGGAAAIHGKNVPFPLKTYDVPSYGLTRTFQDVRIFEQMTVLDNLLVVLTKRDLWGSLTNHLFEIASRRAEEGLKQVGLWEKRHDLAVRCSYGQRKLLEIARALAMDADVYLFDEPFAGLFPEMVKAVMVIMKDLKRREKTIVLIEHDMSLIRQLCDDVIVLDAGSVLAMGKPEAVLAQRNVMEAYLGA